MGRRPATTLCVFIQALEGSKLVIELRSDSIVRGTLLSVDERLNMQLEDATLKSLDGREKTAKSLYLRGSSVRFIHLPGNLDPAAAIAAQRKRAAQTLRDQAARSGSGQQRIEKGQIYSPHE